MFNYYPFIKTEENMHFYALHDVAGRILFQSNNFYLLSVDSSAFVESHNVSDVPGHGNFSGFPVCNNFKLEYAFSPRYPSIIFCSKESFRYIINNEDLEAIEEHVLNTADMELQKLLLIIKSVKGRTENLDIRPFFMACHEEAGQLEWQHSDICPENAVYKFTFGNETFALNVSQASVKPVSGVFFVNEFESVYVPLNDSDQFNKMWNKVKKRSTLDGRISGQYVVVPTAESHRCKVTVQSLKHMKTEDMLDFFGHQRKGATKVETLSGCLENLTRRHVNNLEVGDVGLLQITTHGVAETPIEVPPIDWILSRCSHMKIKFAEPVNNNTTNIFVEVVKDPVDDIAQALYTMFEQTKKEIQMAFFDQHALSKIFDHIRTSTSTVSV